MARAGSIWANTNTAHFDAGLTAANSILLYWLTEVLQNVEHIAQTHAHLEGATAPGGVLVLNNGKSMMYYLGAY